MFVPQTSGPRCTWPVQKYGLLRTTEQSATTHGTLGWHWQESGTLKLGSVLSSGWQWEKCNHGQKQHRKSSRLCRTKWASAKVKLQNLDPCVCVCLTPALQRMPSGCPEVHGTKTGLSSRPPGNPPATSDPPPVQKSKHMPQPDKTWRTQATQIYCAGHHSVCLRLYNGFRKSLSRKVFSCWLLFGCSMPFVFYLVITSQHSGGIDGDCGFGENVVPCWSIWKKTKKHFSSCGGHVMGVAIICFLIREMKECAEA